MNEDTIIMQWKKSTKNTHVYEKVSSDPRAINSVYVERSVVGDAAPKEITIVVRWPK